MRRRLILLLTGWLYRLCKGHQPLLLLWSDDVECNHTHITFAGSGVCAATMLSQFGAEDDDYANVIHVTSEYLKRIDPDNIEDYYPPHKAPSAEAVERSTL